VREIAAAPRVARLEGRREEEVTGVGRIAGVERSLMNHGVMYKIGLRRGMTGDTSNCYIVYLQPVEENCVTCSVAR
jgi:hypothetical protein